MLGGEGMLETGVPLKFVTGVNSVIVKPLLLFLGTNGENESTAPLTLVSMKFTPNVYVIGPIDDMLSKQTVPVSFNVRVS
jgi:hypothetical protein